MDMPPALLQCIGKAVLQSAAGSLLGEFAVEVLPEIAQDAWKSWSSGRDADELRADVEAVAQAEPEDVRSWAEEVLEPIAGGQPPKVRDAVAAYLTQVPGAIRQALRRPSEPTGTRLPTGAALERADDLLPFLPVRLAHFQAGDRPLPETDWELVELLGLGPFGELWKARDAERAGPPVVLKFCLDPASAKVLRGETRLLERVVLHARHIGIVPLLRAYPTARPAALEYEYVECGDLAGLLHTWRRQPGGAKPRQVAKLVQRLAEVLAFAHRLEPPLVHRDLKPSNVLVQRFPDGKLFLRVADFGQGGMAISQVIRAAHRGTDGTLQRLLALRGAATPLYASPQQLRGDDADPRDDVYSLGMIWYQLLTGDPTAGRPADPSWTGRLVERGMSRPLIDLLTACLSEDPGGRPVSGAHLTEQLKTALRRDKQISEGGASAAPRLTNSIGMALALVPAGTFWMGSPPTESERGNDEGPHHKVTLTHPFYLGIYPVTQRQYEAVMEENPSYFTAFKGGGPDHPVERVSWHEAVEFCRRLSELPAEREAGRAYRLPTEAEWEYACRAGTATAFAFGGSLSAEQANFNGNYPYGGASRGRFLETTSKVGAYPPNAWGLHDLHGNVWEWCNDYYEPGYYKRTPEQDPPGPPQGHLRVVRGGSCCNIGRFCRSAYRFGVAPGNRDLDVGFRVVMTQGGEE